MTSTFSKSAPNQSPMAPAEGRPLAPLPGFKFSLLLFGLFALSMAVQLAHHFLCDHGFVMFAFDGRHYFATAQDMCGAMLLLAQGNLPQFLATIGSEQFTSNILFDGPIISGIPALLFALAGHVPKETDWPWLAVFFSLVASYCVVLTATFTRIVTGDSRAAALAGLLFAFYPSTIIATGVYRSEMLATALLLSFIAALYFAPRNKFAAALAGFIGGIFALAKPGFIPAIGLLCLFTAMHVAPTLVLKKGALAPRVKLLLLFAVTGILTIAPWSIYTAADCGKLCITAERLPGYNAGVGTDLAADGWCTMPETAHTAKAHASSSPSAIFAAEWKAHPYELARLTLRRLTRLWANPWNDFREPVFGISLDAQVAIHMVLVTLGFMGLALYLFFPPAGWTAQSKGNARFLGNLAAIALLSHLSFVLFQTMGRYAYSSMPLLCLFGATGIFILCRSAVRSQQGRFRTLGPRLAAGLGVAIAFFIFGMDGFTHGGENTEASHVLPPGQIACRSLDLSPGGAGDTRVSSILLLVDCDLKGAQASDLALHLNGRPLKGRLLPLNCYSGINYALFDTMSEHAAYLRSRVQDMRQWRAVLVAPDELDMVALDGLNEIELVNGGQGDIVVYGDIAPARPAASNDGEPAPPLTLPSPDYFASDRMLVSLTSKESRINTMTTAAVVPSRSYIKTTEGSLRVAKPVKDSLRLMVALVTSPASSATTVDTTGGAEPGDAGAALEQNIAPEKFSWFAREPGGIRLNKAVLKGIGAANCEVDLSSVEAGRSCTQIEVTVSGRARLDHGPGRLGFAAAVSDSHGKYISLGQIPDCLLLPKSTSKEDWTDFSLTDVVPLSKLGGPGKLGKLSLSLLPCPRMEAGYGAGKQCSDISVKDLHLSVKPLALAEIAGKQLNLF